jgi:toxin HigB-1
MIRSFRNPESEDVFDGDTKSKKARNILPVALWGMAWRKLDQINRVTELQHLSVPPGNKLKTLRDDRKGQHSIRINDQYRVCFRWANDGAHDVEVTDYH